MSEKELGVQQHQDEPYNPRFCSTEFAERIINISKDIKLFDEVKHLTSLDALSNILDVGFRGRKSMVRDYQTFRKAALSPFDCKRGDADVICFSGSEIDERCMKENTVELVFDLEKIRQFEHDSPNPCMFFKQRDLGLFKSDKKREVRIGDATVCFDHTSFDNRASSNFRTRVVFNDSLLSTVSDFSLISHNVAEMDSTLVMNFFRFLDGVIDQGSTGGVEFVEEVYSKLEILDDENLREALTDLGKNASDTMEFNFYGHFLADPVLLKEIKFYKESGKLEFSLKVSELIDSLKSGEREDFDLAKENIPQLFESYRFLEYLQSHNANEDLKGEIKSLIQESKVPSWRSMVLHDDRGNDGDGRS